MHSTDGLDEISPSAPTDVWEVTAEGEIKEYQICPADFGLAVHDIKGVSGGTAEERVQWFLAVLDGEAGPVRDFIILNAAAVSHAWTSHAGRGGLDLDFVDLSLSLPPLPHYYRCSSQWCERDRRCEEEGRSRRRRGG